jgi:hypothetical protein
MSGVVRAMDLASSECIRYVFLIVRLEACGMEVPQAELEGFRTTELGETISLCCSNVTLANREKAELVLLHTMLVVKRAGTGVRRRGSVTYLKGEDTVLRIAHGTDPCVAQLLHKGEPVEFVFASVDLMNLWTKRLGEWIENASFRDDGKTLDEICDRDEEMVGREFLVFFYF